VSCDVCGRTLLRGEEADVFLAGGTRRNVCELCTQRASHEGWIREGLDDATVRSRAHNGRSRSFLARLRQRRADAQALHDELESEQAAEALVPADPVPQQPRSVARRADQRRHEDGAGARPLQREAPIRARSPAWRAPWGRRSSPRGRR
jgi:hypothetical protein